jgi:serine/threonine-protein kinase
MLKSVPTLRGVHQAMTRDIRRQFAFLAVLGVVGYVSYVFIETVPVLTRGLPMRAIDKLNIAGNIGGVLISLALLFTALTRRIWVPHLVRLALILEVLVCFLIALETTWRSSLSGGRIPAFSWVTIIILIFPLIVPSTPLRTFVASLASAATIPAGMAVLQAAGAVHNRPIYYLTASIPTLIAVAGAVLGSMRAVGFRRRFGNFQLMEKVGEGGRGEVWKAKHRFVEKYAAIKFIRPEILNQVRGRSRGEILDEFFREADIVSQLASPQTAALFDFGITEAGTLYFVKEYLEGLTLEELVDKHGPQPPNRVRHILYEVLQPLSEAHGKVWVDGQGTSRMGLIHRDIKPSNVFILIEGLVFDYIKLLDWGIAFLGGPPEIRGTPGFMAPEQIEGGDITARTDVYGVGCLAYWLLTGCHVFPGNPQQMMERHKGPEKPIPPSRRVVEEPHPAGAVTWEIPKKLDAAVLKCLEKDPALRPKSVDALRDLLEESGVGDWSYADGAAWWARKEPRFAGKATVA